MAKFSAGQKVVCIDASDTDGELICGEVYEVMLRGVDYYDHCVKIAGSSHWNEARFTLYEPKKEIMNNASKIPHIHAEMIIAWAGGAEIEYLNYISDGWLPVKDPTWNTELQFRIKPEPTYPKTSLTSDEIVEVWRNTETIEEGCLDVANEAIKHFIVSGDMDKYVESLK